VPYWLTLATPSDDPNEESMNPPATRQSSGSTKAKSKSKKTKGDGTKPMAGPRVTVTFLGGLGEIGRNCAAIEQDGQIVLLDCGLMFPEADMPGVDLVLPDFTWLRDNADRVVGCIATHGHEDHVGGLSYLLRELSFPIYGSALTLALARGRIEEAGLVDRTEFVTVTDGERRRIGPFDVEFIPVTHSVPHGFATVFHTAQGVIMHTGDFKIDLTPVDGRLTDLGLVGAIAKDEGIRLLLSDSTNADEAGYSRSETSVGQVLYDLFHAHEGKRVITTCFASHIHRVQQIADAAIAFDRVVATMGRSMERNVRLAREMGLLSIPDDRLRDVADIGDLEPGRVCVISTGSQGEPMSALSRMAAGEHRYLKIQRDDVVIMSSHPIPGNEMNVSAVINGLVRMGAEVVHSGISDVHASGHAKSEELKTMLSIARPDWFVPVHGEYRHLAAHARIAKRMGVADDHVLVCEDGDRVVLGNEGLVVESKAVPAGYLFVDGIVGDISQGVLRDRQALAEEGVVVVFVGVDVSTGAVLTGPQVITRGWVHAAEAEDLIEGCRQAVADAIADAARHAAAGPADVENLQRVVRKAAGRYVSAQTKRRPMIVPVVMEA
jgi:ribonuclease J